MYIPKRYGESKIQKCPFCDKQATVNNSQGIPTCVNHKDELLVNLRCACGSYLESRSGKFGPYFHCMNCGNVNFKKAMEMNDGEKRLYKVQVKKKPGMEVKESKKHYESRSREITVTSDELDLI